jgi:hypothetical protein
MLPLRDFTILLLFRLGGIVFSDNTGYGIMDKLEDDVISISVSGRELSSDTSVLFKVKDIGTRFIPFLCWFTYLIPFLLLLFNMCTRSYDCTVMVFHNLSRIFSHAEVIDWRVGVHLRRD